MERKRSAAQRATEFKKGWKGGPGKPALPPEVKVIRQVTRDDLVDLAMMVLKGDTAALKDVIRNAEHADPRARPTAMQVLMASCLLKAIQKGDSTTLNGLMDRFFGRTPIAIQVQKVEDAAGSTAKQIVFETVVVNATKD